MLLFYYLFLFLWFSIDIWLNTAHSVTIINDPVIWKLVELISVRGISGHATNAPHQVIISQDFFFLLFPVSSFHIRHS